MVEDPDAREARYRRALHSVSQRPHPTFEEELVRRATSYEFSAVVSDIADDADLLEFDRRDPEQWSTVLRRRLREELQVLVSDDDMRYIDAYMQLAHRAEWASPAEWTEYLVQVQAAPEPPQPPAEEPPPAIIVDEVVVPGPMPRCASDAPRDGHIDEGDEDNAPPHGTWKRYNSAKFKCRCEHCRTANTVYRRGLAERAAPQAEIIPLGASSAGSSTHVKSDSDRGSRRLWEGDSR